ncbi:MAG: hypothetical protein Q7J59_01605 [Elusimicrobiota bacterium]|nr:hypothetical protein [Elusimicrobiota bacterium]
MMKIKMSCCKAALILGFFTAVFASPSEAEIQSERIRTLGVNNYIAKNNWNPKFNLIPGFMRDDTYETYGENYFLEYEFAADSFATYEGALTDEKLGLNIGLTAEIDNNLVGKINKYSGYLGIKSLMLRMESGGIRGSAVWTGLSVSSMPATVDFDSSYSNVSLVYWIGKAPIDYIGLNYVSFGLPIQIDTMYTKTDKTKQLYGNPVYDKDFEAKIYALSFGMDTLVTPLLFPDAAKRSEFYKLMAESEEKSKGMGAFMSMQSLFGLGSARVSDEALRFAEVANPDGERKAVNGKHTVGYVAMDLSFGLQYKLKNRFALGLGYNWAVTSLTPFGGGADNPTELGYTYSFNLMRHGPILRAYFSF